MKILKVTDEKGNEKSCNERCYDAYKKNCTCICHGLNHGVGIDVAREQSFEILIDLIEDLEPGHKVSIPDKARQEEFDL